jgi:hypothetical protein
MALAKLDAYDYTILPGVIRIAITSTNDPDLVDILSEISRFDGRIYVEGCRYSYLDNYRLYTVDGESFIELDVVEVL